MPRWAIIMTLRACCKAGSSLSRLETLMSMSLRRGSGMLLRPEAARNRSHIVLSGM